jgi:hypothetical protein
VGGFGLLRALSTIRVLELLGWGEAEGVMVFVKFEA